MTTMPEDAALPPMWTESIDQRTGEIYYYNVLTAERTTKRPHGKTYDRKPSKRSSEGTLPSGGVRTPYAFYTDEYKLQKYRAMDRNMDLDKSNSNSRRKSKPRYKDYYYGDEMNIEDEDNDSYGVILDSYSSDGSDSNPQRGERSTATTEKSSSSHKHHHQDHQRSSHKRSSSKSKSTSKSKSKRHNSRSHSPTHRGDTRSKSPLRSKSMHSSSNQRHDSQHRRKKRSHVNSSNSNDDAGDHKSKKKTEEAKTLLQQLEEERRKLDEKKQKLAQKEKELQQQKENMEQERKKQEEELKQKAAMEEKERREAFDKEENIRRSLLHSETTRQAKEAEEMARQLEQRTHQLIEKEKQLEEERRSMLQKLKQEEEIRQEQAALQEKARREAFEKEENRRLQMIRMQTKRQVKEAEEKAQKKAREAEEARRKAEEKAEQARQQAAALEMARLKAEQEAQLAKQKAVLQEEAHLQAVREAQLAKKDALAKKEQQDRALKKAQNAAVEAERKRVQAERKAHLEEQKRFKEELKRQRLEESMAASYDDHEFYQDDSDKSQSSSSSKSVSINNDVWYSDLHVEDDREGTAANQDSMERSMDIGDIFDDNSPNRSVQKASTARERKRVLEMKYQSGHTSTDTMKSSGVNDASAGTMTSKGEKGLRSVPLSGEGEDQGPVKSGRRWFQRRVPREQTESGDRSGQDKSSASQGETRSTAVVLREEQAITEIPKSGRRWFRRSKSQDAEEFEALARDDQSKETRPGLLRQLSRPGIQRTSSDTNRPGMLRQGSRPGIQRTPSDSKRPGMERQGSRPGIQRTSSDTNRPEMQRQGSRPGIQRTSSNTNRPEMQRQGSRPGIQRTSSDTNRPEMQRQGSRPGIQRSTSSGTNKPGMFRQWSRSGNQRSSSDSNQIERMRRDPDRRDVAPRSKSMDAIRREDSGRPAMRRTKSSDMSNFNHSFQMPSPPQAKKKKKSKMEYERPPKSLVLIWLLVAGKLAFDLGTTIIAVRALIEEDNCCGFPIKIGGITSAITFPFFALVATELAMLFQAIIQTLCPNIMEAQQAIVLGRSTFMKIMCCCFRWNVRTLMRAMSFLLLLNPFFGCLIAWMLLYQSDKKDAFIVLGFEAGSLALHYISVCLEGSITGFFTFIQNGLLPLVPFAVSVGMVLFYLKQGGVCYIVAEEIFNFNGCEVCLNGYPPVNGTCRFANGTTYPFEEQSVFDLRSYNSLESVVSRTEQVSYCAYENPSGPDTNFCFYDFEDGLLDGRVENDTMSEILNATNATVNTNKCGGTVPHGARQAQCHQYLWDLVNDDTFHCLSMGGPGDPCQLSIENDGENEGRFKDPSACQPNSALSDTFYLWDEPLAYGKDFAWAGNSWLAYSATRWIAQVQAMREMGVRVASPAVRYESPEQVRDHFTEFFDACRPSCVTPDDPSFVDILALRVFCDPDVEFCDKKVEEVTGVLMDISASFNSRPVHITAWGVLKTDETTKLLEAMKVTNGFFEDGSPVERVYWWGGGATDFTNLLKTTEGQDETLGDAWVDICKKIK